MAKKALGAPDARRKWCACCDEFAAMIDREVKENPRYNEFDPKTLKRRQRPSMECDN